MTPAPTKHSEALRAARELLSDPKRWTQGFFAVSGDQFQVFGNDPSAVCFCALGALQKVTDPVNPYNLLGEAWLEKAVGETVGNFNDTHSHAEVLAAFDRAIALAEEAGQ